MKMITLLGVGHVFSIRKAIRHLIIERMPDVVCVELDKIRFNALESGILHNDDAPFLMKRLQRIYEKAADSQGASIGEEMLSGVETAREINVPYILIDVEANTMVNTLLNSLSVGQKIKIAGQVLTASVLPYQMIEEGLKKVQDDPEAAMVEFEKQYPDLKRSIVDQRDQYMAARLKEICIKYENIVCIVGEGHINGIIRALPDMDIEVVHLKEIIAVAKGIEDGKIAEPPSIADKIDRARSWTMDFGYSFNVVYEEDSN